MDSSSTSFAAVPTSGLDEKEDTTTSTCTSVPVDSTEMIMPLPKYLPDIDDMSMNSVLEYMDYCDQDMYYSVISNSMFIAGGICYVALSLWRMEKYYGLDLIAPSVYLINAFIDVVWARQVVQRGKIKRKIANGWEEWRVTAGEITRTEADTAQPWCHRLYKHTAHRRSHLAAITFGLAAALAVSQVLINWYRPEAEQWSHFCGSMSIHVYLVSAIICVTGKRNRPWFQGSSQLFYSPHALEDMGDLFFLLGSLLDEILTDMTWDDMNSGFWAMVSALLWLADACFYLRGDVLIMATRKNPDAQNEQMLV